MTDQQTTTGDATVDVAPDDSDRDGGGSRRSLLAKGGVAAAVAAAAGVGLAREARAADDDPMLVGGDHTGTTSTELTGSTFRVNSASDPEGSIVGISGGSSVVGVNGVSIGADGQGVRGASTGLGSPRGRGVFGDDTTEDGTAVYGQHGQTFPGTGVHAESRNGTGIVAKGGLPIGGFVDSLAEDPVDVSLAGTGLLEFTAPQAITPTTSGVAGRLVRGTDGNLWFSTGADSWEQITGLPAATTPAGQTFTPLDPFRAYDSRLDSGGRLDADSERTIVVKDARDLTTGDVVTADVIPTGTTAIAFNLTAIGTEGIGFLAVTPGSASTFGASAVNWVGPTTIANSGIVTVDGSLQAKVFAGPGGSAHLALDITGFWSP
ncbi:MAG: hypothetical protein AAGF91_13295 [Actinomycetota bacterium]